MGETEDIHLYRRILGVVAVDVELELARDLPRVDGDLHFGGSLVEQGEHGLVYVVVDEDDAMLRRFYEVCHKGVGIIYLSIVENALLRLRPDGETPRQVVCR